MKVGKASREKDAEAWREGDTASGGPVDIRYQVP
jgi:hypothetical protein